MVDSAAILVVVVVTVVSGTDSFSRFSAIEQRLRYLLVTALIATKICYSNGVVLEMSLIASALARFVKPGYTLLACFCYSTTLYSFCCAECLSGAARA